MNEDQPLSHLARRVMDYWSLEQCTVNPPSADLSAAPGDLAALYSLADGVEHDPLMISFHPLKSWRPLSEAGEGWVCFADWADNSHLYAFQRGVAGSRVGAFGRSRRMFREWRSFEDFLESYLERAEELIEQETVGDQ